MRGSYLWRLLCYLSRLEIYDLAKRSLARVTQFGRVPKGIHCIFALETNLLRGVFRITLSKPNKIYQRLNEQSIQAHNIIIGRRNYFSREKRDEKGTLKGPESNQWLLVFSWMTSLASALDFCSQVLIQASDSCDSIKLVVMTALPEATRPSPPHFLYSVP